MSDKKPSEWARAEAMNIWVEIGAHEAGSAQDHIAIRLDAARAKGAREEKERWTEPGEEGDALKPYGIHQACQCHPATPAVPAPSEPHTCGNWWERKKCQDCALLVPVATDECDGDNRIYLGWPACPLWKPRMGE